MAEVENSLELSFPIVIPIEIFSLAIDKENNEKFIKIKKIKKRMLVIFDTFNSTKKKFLSHLLCPIIRDRFHKKIQALIIIFTL